MLNNTYTSAQVEEVDMDGGESIELDIEFW